MPYAVVSSSKKKLFNIIKHDETLDELKITVPTFNDKKSSKYAKKICRILRRYKVDVVILDNTLSELSTLKNILYENNNYIVTGRRLFKVIILLMIKDINKILELPVEKTSVAVCVNEYSIENIDLIECLSQHIKSLTIVTENEQRYKRNAELIFQKYGAVVQVIGKQRVNLKHNTYVVNVDMLEEDLKRINIPKECIIISITNKVEQLKKSFNGIIINDVDIALNKHNNNFRTIALCEAYIYNYQKNIVDNERIFSKSGYFIDGYVGNNGKICYNDFKRLKAISKNT